MLKRRYHAVSSFSSFIFSSSISYLSVCLTVIPSSCLSVCHSFFLSACLSVIPSSCLSVCHSSCLPVCLAVRHSSFLSVWLSVIPSSCLSVCLPVILPVFLSVCLSHHTIPHSLPSTSLHLHLLSQEGTDEWTVVAQSLLMRALRSFHGSEAGYRVNGEDKRVVRYHSV
jgi:hypothetical protein